MAVPQDGKDVDSTAAAGARATVALAYAIVQACRAQDDAAGNVRLAYHDPIAWEFKYVTTAAGCPEVAQGSAVECSWVLLADQCLVSPNPGGSNRCLDQGLAWDLALLASLHQNCPPRKM